MKGQVHDMRKAVKRSDPQSIDFQLPLDSADRKHFLFYQDEGGMRATDDVNQQLDAIYYLGIIDICTPYNTAKKLEHFWKSMTEDRVSPNPARLIIANHILRRPRYVRPAIHRLYDVHHARRGYISAPGGSVCHPSRSPYRQ